MAKNNVIVKKENTANEVKYYVFVKNSYRHYAPQYLTISMTIIPRLFPVSESNTIGIINKMNNDVVFLTFSGHGVESEYNVVAQDFSMSAYGSFNYSFSPNFSEDMVAYCKTRVAVIANVKTGETFHAESDLSTDDYLLGIRFLNPQKKLFVIAKSIDEGGSGWEDYLHITKLENQELISTGWSMKIGTTSEITSDFPLYHTWFVHDSKLFVYDRDRARILCTDGVQSVSHPFSDIFNSSPYSIGNIKDLMLHPELPFGVMIEEFASNLSIFHRLFIVRWDTKKTEEQIVPDGKMFEPLASLFGLERMALAYQSFSPDGNWYVVGCIALDEPKNSHFIAIPIDREHPDFLDRNNIVVLGQVKGMTSLAWTSAPVSFVVSDGEILHKWDLDELPNARIFVMPDEGDSKKRSIFRRIGGLFGAGK